MDSPIELPDGRLVCGRHGLIVCGSCCVDYSFMEEVLEDSETALDRETEELYNQLSPESRADIDARWGPPHPEDRPDPTTGLRGFRRGTGRAFPSKFSPPSTTSIPSQVFPAGIGRRASPPVHRFIRGTNSDEFLIFTDGACLNNGQTNPRAGWAFVLKPETNEQQGVVSGRLENKGPFGDNHAQTSNRAELRAVLAALRFRHWPGEGFTKLVIATDSEYVSKGATEWAQGWIRHGWQTRGLTAVKNRDLWELLLGEVERWNEHGLKIEFWRIPRSMNIVADLAAKLAAGGAGRDEFLDVKGILI